MQIKYFLRRSKRRKTIQIKIDPVTAKVTVSAPQYTPLEKNNNFVISKENWILKKQKQILEENIVSFVCCDVTIHWQAHLLAD